MAKSLGAVLNTLYGPISGFAINGKQGFMQGLGNATAAASGPVTFGAYVAGAALGGLKSRHERSKPKTRSRWPFHRKHRATASTGCTSPWRSTDDRL